MRAAAAQSQRGDGRDQRSPPMIERVTDQRAEWQLGPGDAAAACGPVHVRQRQLVADGLADVQLVEVVGQPKPHTAARSVPVMAQQPVAGPVLEQARRIQVPDSRGIAVVLMSRRSQRTDLLRLWLTPIDRRGYRSVHPLEVDLVK